MVFSVPEDKVAAIKPGSDVTVRVWTNSHRAAPARCAKSRRAPIPVTRTYPVKVSLDAAAAPPLGATVYVSPQALSRAGTPVIKLPTSALRQEGQGTAVWVLDKSTMTVKSQPVQIATADGNEAVIAGGPAAGHAGGVRRRARAVARPEGHDLPGEGRPGPPLPCQEAAGHRQRRRRRPGR